MKRGRLDLTALDDALRALQRRVEKAAAARDRVVHVAEEWATGRASDGELVSAIASLRAARRRDAR